ncbi:MAG TPA: hypothetical protein VGY58_16305, partial [Gemmataceae bacterium]|nr:hypothetical protein [Gemmataceae bacterium]
MAAVRQFPPRGIFFLALGALLSHGAFVAADPGDGEARLFAAASAAVANNRIAKTEAAGFTLQKTPFSETPAEGGVLVGFDIALGKFVRDETIVGLRPIYRTARGEVATQEYGPFRSADSGGNKKFPRNQAIRTLRVTANPSYAVGAIALRTAIGIRGMSLTFMRVQGEALDSQQSYTSAWIGSDTGGREASLNCGGAPVVGAFGNQDEQRVLALGLIYIGDGSQAAVSTPGTARSRKGIKSARPADGPSRLDRLKELVQKEEATFGKSEPEGAAKGGAKSADPKAEPPAAIAAGPTEKAEEDEAAQEAPPLWQTWKVTVPVALGCFIVVLFFGVQWFRPATTDAALLASHQGDAAEALLPPGSTTVRPPTRINPLATHKVINGMVALVVGVAIALIAYDAAKKAGRSEPFHEFTSAEGKFRVEIPGTPKQDTAYAVGIPLIMFHVEERNGAYGVAYADVPMVEALSSDQLKHALDSARDGMVANVKGKFLGESSIRL